MIKVVLMAGALVVGSSYFAAGMLKANLPGMKRAEAQAPEEVKPGSVRLRADPDGHFRADAVVGGKRIPMLVDTGATVVSLPFETGATLGLASWNDRFDIRINTANGTTTGKLVTLRDVRIGSVRVEDVQAVVLSPGAMRTTSLLGMSFLGRLRRVETARNQLTMER